MHRHILSIAATKVDEEGRRAIDLTLTADDFLLHLTAAAAKARR